MTDDDHKIRSFLEHINMNYRQLVQTGLPFEFEDASNANLTPIDPFWGANETLLDSAHSLQMDEALYMSHLFHHS